MKYLNFVTFYTEMKIFKNFIWMFNNYNFGKHFLCNKLQEDNHFFFFQTERKKKLTQLLNKKVFFMDWSSSLACMLRPGTSE